MRPKVSATSFRPPTIRSSSIKKSDRALWFALVCCAVAGCLALLGAPQSVFPAIQLARVELFADAGELPSEQVRTLVAAPLESALSTLPGIREMRAYSNPGKLEIELDFEPRGDVAQDLASVRAVAESIRGGLPVTRIETVVEGPEEEPAVTYALTSKSIDQAELYRRVDAELTPAFTGLAQLGRLTLFGGPELAYDVTLDHDRLARRGLSASTVARAIASASRESVAGSLVRGQERLTVLSSTEPANAAELGALAIAAPAGRPVALRDLGSVRMREEETGRQASFDARHAVLLNIYAAPGGDAVALRRGADERLAALRSTLPADVSVTTAWDQTRLIAASQDALRVEIGLGAAIALLVIFAFLRDRALVLAAAIVLPLAVIFTLAAVARAGLRLDLMTIGGVAIAIGLIVDEAIVVIEALARARDAGEPSAVRRIAKPLLAATAANLVVFLPLASLHGIPGFFFRPLAITLAIALVVSSALSLLVVPRLAAAFRFRTRETRGPNLFESLALRALRIAAPRAWPVIAACLALAVGGAFALARLPNGFLPDVDEGQFEIKYSLPPGMSLAAADGVATRFEEQLLLDPVVAHVARLSGVDTNGYLPTPPDAGTIRVVLKPDAARAAFDPIAEHVRAELRSLDPYVAVEVHQLLEDQINDLSGAPEPIQLTVGGPDQTTLNKIAGELADALVDVDGLVDIFDGVTYEARSIRATTDASASADDVRARIGGIAAGTLPTDEGQLPVIVREAPGPGRGVVFDRPQIASTVFELNGARVVRVTGDLEDNVDLTKLNATIQTRIARVLSALPAGYTVSVGGVLAADRSASLEFATILGLAFLLVFFVLLVTFDSFRLPLVALASVPLTPIGVAIALAVTRTPLNVASLMGLLLLVGVVVRNGILLVESANRRERAGIPIDEAVEAAVRERLRPILMTTLATLAALGPLALGLGAGSELERPLAIAVIGGIVSSTALTLVVVPLLHVSLYRKRRVKSELNSGEPATTA